MGTLDSSMTLEQLDTLVEEALVRRGTPNRVHYAAGVLLDADDFAAEQDYHRGRLARVLSALFGFGTLAGLRVNAKVTDNPELEIHVAPGLALDRIGRLIEIRREQCLSVKRWLARYAALPKGDAQRAMIADAVRGGADKVLVCDVFARFAACNNGKTPAFAAGPFNATDYVVPSRKADAFEVKLSLAATGTGNQLLSPGSALPPLDEKLAELAAIGDPDARAEARRAWALEHVLNAWDEPDPGDNSRLVKLREQGLVENWNDVFLARVTLPVRPRAVDDDFPEPDPARLTDTTGNVDLADNASRPIVFIPTAWRGLS